MMLRIFKKRIALMLLTAVVFVNVGLSYGSDRRKPRKEAEIKNGTIQQNSNKPQADEDPILLKADELPQFPGGINELRQYLQWKLKYPMEAQRKGVQGVVFVNFVVEKDGRVNLVKVVRSVDYSLDSEAIRVVKSMPRWTPGKLNGEAVRVSFTLPINFAFR